MELVGDFEASNGEPMAGAMVEVVDPREARHVLLKKVFTAHCLLDVRFEHDVEAYQSAILELVPDAGYLVLDALTPASGDAVAAQSLGFRVRTRLEGVDLKFASRIIQRGSQRGLPYYKVLYPQAVESEQRRHDYRVAVPFDRGVPVRFYLADGTMVRGELRDLSGSGFSARLLSGDISKLAPDASTAYRCELDLPGHKIVEAKVEIRHIAPSRARSAPRVGVCFIGLDPQHERLLERCVVELDRARLRSS